jgi:hypothetical protein
MTDISPAAQAARPMPPAAPAPAVPEPALRARQMYCEGARVRAIRAATGLSPTQLYLWIDGGPLGADGRRALAPLPRRLAGQKRQPDCQARALLVARLLDEAEMQVRAIEQSLAAHEQALAACEAHEAHVRAVVIRALRALAAHDARAMAKPEPPASSPVRAQPQDEVQDVMQDAAQDAAMQDGAAEDDRAENDPIPRDIDELRDVLARRLDQIGRRRTSR